MIPKKPILAESLLLLLLGLAVIAALCAGRYAVKVSDIFRIIAGMETADPRAKTVILSLRLPRVLLASLCGAGLSAAGVGLQAMFGNPLVSSHILGVSASAGFGAALGILLFGRSWAVQGMALLFGFGGMFIVCAMSRRQGRTGILLLVLSGVIVTAVFEALTSLVKYVADPEEKLPAITYYLMGSLASASFRDVFSAGPAVLAGVIALWVIRWRLNVIALSEDEAVSLGIDIRRVRTLIVIATTLIAASIVSVCGIISFVGLAAPHFARMLVGSDHRRLLGTSVVLGGVFVLAVDTLCRTVGASEIPLSIVTAVVGAPVFAFLLRRSEGSLHD
ncbi:MAG: iron ABC transporter permease [Spirochaetaceae bacterium]|nr:iron ABC transporter permease [Spirochaetaceae bacterium]